ncbi:MAG TPA: hypothetical protein DCR71_01930 [Dehalococcoidia bacterium]|jgi:hypothetical protein|nr:hypothetical protein [Dehalococcoidia bacterium]HAS27644.1 hypothetical protein [Dehalococcoidia bacterium]
MTDWQLTATTIFCEDMNDEVTVILYKDGKTRCTGYDFFARMSADPKSKKALSGLKCDGPVCHRVSAYKEKIFSEEESSTEL